MAAPRILVIGGNGFLGSAVCKAAVARGWDVSSISSSGKPYTTPGGHIPKWAHEVQWHQASAFEPSSYSGLVASSSAIVHTLGILLEDAEYKAALRRNDVMGLAKTMVRGLTSRGNPLRSLQDKQRGYEGMNRDSALTVLDTLLSSSQSSSELTRPFVFVSAADCFRPLVPPRYIETKREAESEILRRCMEKPEAGVRPVFIRPGLIYHPHVRPLSTVPAFLLSLSAGLHDKIRIPLPVTPSSLLGGVSEALRTHPLHVDHVADGIIRSIADEDRIGVVDIDTMRAWAGFGEDGSRKPRLQI